jgi:hypothetical protein
LLKVALSTKNKIKSNLSGDIEVITSKVR